MISHLIKLIKNMSKNHLVIKVLDLIKINKFLQ